MNLLTIFKELNEEDLERQKILGKGSFGVVYACKYKPTKGVYAAKCFQLTESNQQKVQIGFYSEIQILSKLNHPNIVGLFG